MHFLAPLPRQKHKVCIISDAVTVRKVSEGGSPLFQGTCRVTGADLQGIGALFKKTPDLAVPVIYAIVTIRARLAVESKLPATSSGSAETDAAPNLGSSAARSKRFVVRVESRRQGQQRIL